MTYQEAFDVLDDMLDLYDGKKARAIEKAMDAIEYVMDIEEENEDDIPGSI